MKFDILTLFPDLVDTILSESIIGRARAAGIIEVRCHQIRDFANNKHNNVDDTPYGGGNGMVMAAPPIDAHSPEPSATVFVWMSAVTIAGASESVYCMMAGARPSPGAKETDDTAATARRFIAYPPFVKATLRLLRIRAGAN